MKIYIVQSQGKIRISKPMPFLKYQDITDYLNKRYTDLHCTYSAYGQLRIDNVVEVWRGVRNKITCEIVVYLYNIEES